MNVRSIMVDLRVQSRSQFVHRLKTGTRKITRRYGNSRGSVGGMTGLIHNLLLKVLFFGWKIGEPVNKSDSLFTLESAFDIVKNRWISPAWCHGRVPWFPVFHIHDKAENQTVNMGLNGIGMNVGILFVGIAEFNLNTFFDKRSTVLAFSLRWAASQLSACDALWLNIRQY